MRISQAILHRKMDPYVLCPVEAEVVRVLIHQHVVVPARIAYHVNHSHV